MFSKKIIFISPLDWGLGHATRLVPLISELQKNNELILGVGPSHAHFFEALFPHLKKIRMPSYGISYSGILPVWLKIIMLSPKILLAIRKEKRVLEKIILQYSVDLVISDNRYGLNHKNVKSILITHQLHIISPVFASLANRINLKFIQRFNEVWVPDHEALNDRLSGVLSQNSQVGIPIRYLGPQSMFQGKEKRGNDSIDILILLSGVEPQRSILETLLLDKFEGSDLNIVFVRGKTGAIEARQNLKVLDFVIGGELAELIVNARTVICRSGYSTLMDLHVLGQKSCILIPTPGQPEQVYLAKYWKEKFKARVVMQNEVKSLNLNAPESDARPF